MIRWDVSVKRFDLLDCKYRIPQGMGWSLMLHEYSVWSFWETRVRWVGVVKCAYRRRDLLQRYGHTLYLLYFKIILAKLTVIKLLQEYVSTFLPKRRLNLRLLSVFKLVSHVT